MPDQRLLICPYCGETQPESDRCRACAGLFEPLSRQATHNAMGPWFIRNEQRPHHPGCSYETLVKLVERGRVTRYTIVRGPTTRQFWTIAKRVPGISHYFGACYQCDASVDPDDRSCHACEATFGGFLDRNFLGLSEYRPLPWEADRGGERRPDVEPGEPSDWRQQTAQASGGPRGISSFATDEELFGEAPVEKTETAAPVRRDGSETAPAVQWEASGTGSDSAESSPRESTVAVEAAEVEPEYDPEPEPSSYSTPAPAPQPEPGGNEVTIRAMQRAIIKQRQTIRVLSIAAIGIGVIAIVLALLWADLRSATNQVDGQPGQASEMDKAWELPELDPRKPLDPPAAGTDRDQQADDLPDRSETFTDEHRSAYEEARSLIERASDPEDELASRIDDLEQAIAALARLKREVVEEALPEEFSATFTEARRMLERLRLREFFP